MPEGYYCERCGRFVLTVEGVFNHPHLGAQTCLRCRKCGWMVYLKEQGGNYAV